MNLVVDASALVKLVLEEEGSREARREFREAFIKGWEIHVPDIALPEALNALWKHHALLGDLGEEELREAVEDLLKLWRKLELHETSCLARKAVEIAAEHRVTVYDALYLALAIEMNATLLSFDENLRRTAGKLGLPIAP